MKWKGTEPMWLWSSRIFSLACTQDSVLPRKLLLIVSFAPSKAVIYLLQSCCFSNFFPSLLIFHFPHEDIHLFTLFHYLLLDFWLLFWLIWWKKTTSNASCSSCLSCPAWNKIQAVFNCIFTIRKIGLIFFSFQTCLSMLLSGWPGKGASQCLTSVLTVCSF